jgi:hypothetical protein
MPISRMQQPRQMYGLGSFVKSIGKGIKSFVKSDLGKIALLTAGGFGLAGKGPLAGILGADSFLRSTALPAAQSFFGGEKTLGKTLGVMAGGTVLGGVLGALSPEEQEEISSGRNISALRSKLTTAYQNLGYDESEIPALVDNDLSEYTQDMARGQMADGGRIGYAMGTDQIVDQASGIMGLPININKAGVKELDLRETGGFIPPVGVKEKADDIPAMLSNNEFVMTADAVREFGDGDVNKGAQRMYDMMKKLEKGGTV